MIERQRALRSSEIENGRYPALDLRAGDGGRLSRDAQVHMSIDESGNQGKPARVDRVRAARRAGGPGADLRSIDSKGRRLRSRIRESCADDPEHAAEMSRWMPDEADELILKMQHLEAQARAQQDARTKQADVAGLRTAAQRLAAESQHDLAAAEAAEKAAAEKQERARSGGVPPLQAADLLAQGKSEANEARTRAVKARARLNFALDRMDEAERREWEALQAEARAETHAQLAEDPLFKKT